MKSSSPSVKKPLRAPKARPVKPATSDLDDLANPTTQRYLSIPNAARLAYRTARTPRNVKMANGSSLTVPDRESYLSPQQEDQARSARLRRLLADMNGQNQGVTDDDLVDSDPFVAPVVLPPGQVLVAAPAVDYVPSVPPVFDPRAITHVDHLLIADLDPKPVFRMGIEFEGLVRKEAYAAFKASMIDLGYDDEDDVNLIAFGYDDSIKDYPAGYEPVEIRTETVRSRTGIRLLEDMLSFLWIASQTGDWLTNASCGLHINVSEDAVWERGRAIDYYAHVLSLFDETSVLARFGRLNTAHGRKYCKPFFDDGDSRDPESIRHQYQLCKRRERAAADRGDNLNQHIKESKYFAVALRDSPAHDDFDGEDAVATRIEFRCIGNESYHLKLDDLEESINHLISVVRLAYREVMS